MFNPWISDRLEFTFSWCSATVSVLFSRSGVTISDVFFFERFERFFLSNMSAVRLYWSTCTSSFRRFSWSFTICFRLSPVDPIFFIAVACVVVCCSHITLCIPQETPPDGTVSNFCKNGDSGRKSV